MSTSAPDPDGADAAAARAARIERALVTAGLELDATLDALRRLVTTVRRTTRDEGAGTPALVVPSIVPVAEVLPDVTHVEVVAPGVAA